MSLPINTASLISEMRASLAEVNAQIQTIKEETQDAINRNVYEANSVYQIKYTDGHYILTDLLVARANLLAGIANLQASNKRGSW
jgi:hypothetical protein